LEKEVFRHRFLQFEVLKKELEAENSRLKYMFADVSLQRDEFKDLVE
jgi:hypothetical protein